MSFSEKLQNKICETCFLCHSIVLCQTCGKCQKCCNKPTCRGQTTEFLAGLVGPRVQSQNCPGVKVGLHPPLPEQASSIKAPNGHKPLCEPPQEQLPVGGFASAYFQKCGGAGAKPKISRFFQPAFLGTQTQQQVEAHPRFKQSESLSKSGEVQDGNTRNHQNFPSTRGMGHLNRLHGRLLPRTDTGTIQEVPEISRPGADIPIQGPAFWSVHSPSGIHSHSQGSEVNGHAQGYKNPPVPRRLVGEGQVPPSLSPAYQRSTENMPGPGLVSQQGEIRAGTKTSLRLCRLPIRPRVRPGQTHTGPLAGSHSKDSSYLSPADLSGP